MEFAKLYCENFTEYGILNRNRFVRVAFNCDEQTVVISFDENADGMLPGQFSDTMGVGPNNHLFTCSGDDSTKDSIFDLIADKFCDDRDDGKAIVEELLRICQLVCNYDSENEDGIRPEDHIIEPLKDLIASLP